MIALVLALAVAAFWGWLGYVIISSLDRDADPVRNMLLAPTVGFAATMLPVYWLNRVGFPLEYAGPVLMVALITLSVALFLRSQPPLPSITAAGPFLILTLIAAVLVGRPMFDFGFDWISFGNEDMAVYALRAHRYLSHGFFEVPAADDLLLGRDYSQFAWFFDVIAAQRAGPDLLLSWVMSLTGLSAHEVSMPVILAFHLAAISAGSAVFVEHRQDRLAGLIIYTLLAFSALMALGTLYQLLAQVPGLALMAASLATLSRGLKEHLHASCWPRYALLIAVVISALFIAYPLVVPVLAAGVGLHFAIVIAKRRNSALMLQAARIVLIAGIATVIMVNVGLIDLFTYLINEGTVAAGGAIGTVFFPSFLLPSGLPLTWGFASFPVLGNESSYLILIAGLLLLIALVGAAFLAWNEHPGAALLLPMYALAAIAFAGDNGFSLFKLAMISQPFLLGVLTLLWLKLTAQRWIVVSILPVALLVVMSTGSLNKYVDASRGLSSMTEVRGGSDVGIARSMGEFLEKNKPRALVIESPNLVLQEIMVTYTKGTPTAIISDNRRLVAGSNARFGIGALFLPQARSLENKLKPYSTITQFNLHDPANPQALNGFVQVTPLNSAPPSSVDPLWLVVAPKETVLNNRSLGRETEPVVGIPQSQIRNHLVFVSSDYGENYYYFGLNADKRSIFQPEGDYFDKTGRMMAIGRYLLFRVEKPDQNVRLSLAFTASLRQDNENLLPEMAVIGDKRVDFDEVGSGSSRLISSPLKPQPIAGSSYIMIDMGTDGSYPPQPARRGLARLYGGDVRVDSRRIVGYARDISLLSEEEYQKLDLTSSIGKFPDDLLHNRDLEYSGFYEDGWVSQNAFAVLSNSSGQQLVVEGVVPGGVRAIDGSETLNPRLEVLVDGAVVSSKEITPGEFKMNTPYAGTPGRHKVELRFSEMGRLPGGDNRPVSAKLTFLGFK